MKKRSSKLSVMFLLLMLMYGCTSRVLDFTVVSSKNIDMSKSSTFIRGKTRVTGEDKMYIIIFIPTGVAHLKEALDRAIESVPGCVALLDGVIYSKFFYFPYVFGESSYIIEGIPLIDPSLANHDDIPLYRKIELDQKGQIKKTEYLSEKEYMALKEKIVKDYGEIRFNNSEQLY